MPERRARDEGTLNPRRPGRSDRFRDPIATAYDAVVVGAGMGGLVTASQLARAGRRVLVVDGHYVAGGNATVFRRRRWEFDRTCRLLHRLLSVLRAAAKHTHAEG